MLKRLHLFLFRLHRLALKRPKIVIIGLIILLFSTLPFAGQLRFLLAIDDLIEPNFQSYESLQNLKNNFQDSQNLLISIEPVNGYSFSADLICSLQKWALDLSDQRHDLLRINSTFGLRQAQMQGRLLKFRNVLDVQCPSGSPQKEAISKGLKEIQKSAWGNLLSSRNGALTLSIAFSPDESNFRYGQFRTESVAEIQKSFLAAISPWKDQVDIHWAGVAVYQAELRKAFDQTQALNGLMFLVALLIFGLCLRSWKAGFLFIGTVFGTLMITYGVMGAAGIPIDVLTNATGLMLIISCLQDFVFITYGTTYLGYSWKKSMRKFLIPSFYTSLTTVIGFGSLAISDLSIIGRFGAISAFAAALEWVYVFIFLPALLVVIKKDLWPRAQAKPPTLGLQKIMNLQWPRPLALVLLLLIPTALWGAKHLHVEDSPEKFFAKSHIVNVESEHFLQTRGWKAEVSLLFDKNLPEDQKAKIFQSVSEWPQVTSLETNQAMEKFLLSSISDPKDQNAIQSLWQNSVFSKRLSSDSIERAVLYLKTTERADLEDLLDRTHRLCPQNQCELASGLISYIEFGDRVLKTLFESLLVSLLLVLAVLFLLARHLKISNLSAILLASVWGPLALLAIFYLFQVSVFFVTTICASVLVGLSGDNIIQFLFSARQRNLKSSVQDLGPATLIVSLGMILLTTVFYLSPIWPLQKLGSLMILGFALAWIGDVLILKGLVKK